MARIGGRRGWLAWPTAVICGAVITGLVLLAIPGIPGAIAFTGEVLRMGSAAAATATPMPTRAPLAIEGADCRSVYSDALWRDLLWQRDALLTQGQAAPELQAAGVTAALRPDIVLSCGWTSTAGALTTTIGVVRPGAGAIARAALESQGYVCDEVADGVRCTTAGGAGADEEIEVRGTRWLATTYAGWHPSDYGRAVASRLWP